MNLLWLFIALLGLGVLCWSVTQYALNRRRRKGAAPLIGLGAALLGMGFALGAAFGPQGLQVPGGSMTHMGAMSGESHSSGTMEAGKLAFTYPVENEQLDLQDYLLTGNGKPGEELEVFEGAANLGRVTVGPDGTWSFPITGRLVSEGDHEYEARALGAAAGTGVMLKVNVAKGRDTASNAKCPCRIRISTLEKQNIKGATITLLKGGQRVESGVDPKVFGNLSEGEYTYTVEAPGFEPFTATRAVNAPKNKNISVYLKPKR